MKLPVDRWMVDKLRFKYFYMINLILAFSLNTTNRSVLHPSSANFLSFCIHKLSCFLEKSLAIHYTLKAPKFDLVQSFKVWVAL